MYLVLSFLDEENNLEEIELTLNNLDLNYRVHFYVDFFQ